MLPHIKGAITSKRATQREADMMLNIALASS
jgi:hypothetical protein